MAHPRFADRRDAGRQLAARLERERGRELVVIGLARGGVETAFEVARALDAPLDVVAVRKVGHPLQPEYGIGAVTPDGVYVRAHDGLSDSQVAAVVGEAAAQAALLDRRLHHACGPIDLAGKRVLLVDDGLATGVTMIAALRWARSAGAARVVAAVPVAATSSLAPVAREADDVVCVHMATDLISVSSWYRAFSQVDDRSVVALLEENRLAREGSEPHPTSGDWPHSASGRSTPGSG